MLIGGILLGLLLGLWAGGRLSNLAQVQLRWIGVLLVAVIVRFGTEFLLNAGRRHRRRRSACRSSCSGFSLLLAGLWANRGYPGMGIAFVGILFNTIVITVNGGYMPVWDDALAAAGMTPADVHLGAPSDLRRHPRAVPVPGPGPRRHHPDPHPDHPERRLAGRRVPQPRPRLLPVRERGPRPDPARGLGRRGDPRAAHRHRRLDPPAPTRGPRGRRRDGPGPGHRRHRVPRPAGAHGLGHDRPGHAGPRAAPSRQRRRSTASWSPPRRPRAPSTRA